MSQKGVPCYFVFLCSPKTESFTYIGDFLRGPSGARSAAGMSTARIFSHALRSCPTDRTWCGVCAILAIVRSRHGQSILAHVNPLEWSHSWKLEGSYFVLGLYRVFGGKYYEDRLPGSHHDQQKSCFSRAEWGSGMDVTGSKVWLWTRVTGLIGVCEDVASNQPEGARNRHAGRRSAPGKMGCIMQTALAEKRGGEERKSYNWDGSEKAGRLSTTEVRNQGRWRLPRSNWLHSRASSIFACILRMHNSHHLTTPCCATLSYTDWTASMRSKWRMSEQNGLLHGGAPAGRPGDSAARFSGGIGQSRTAAFGLACSRKSDRDPDF